MLGGADASAFRQAVRLCERAETRHQSDGDAAQGTSYQMLLDDVRQELAVELEHELRACWVPA